MSKILKSNQYLTFDQARILNSPKPEVMVEESNENSEDHEIIEEKKEENHVALQKLAELIEEEKKRAEKEIEILQVEAQKEIAKWWDLKRQEDKTIKKQAFEEGYNEGMQAGKEQAHKEIESACESHITQAKEIIQQAHEMERQIISEAEPFLVSLSCAIAEKIIQHELTLDPSVYQAWIKEMLARKREKGMITLCVSPKQLSFVNDAREELQLAINSQADLQILPDSSVEDVGCIIRSELGSVDARIDTQLSEIKKKLLELSEKEQYDE